jgi:formate-dependent nitrite reductase cytochrome c552 subunit
MLTTLPLLVFHAPRETARMLAESIDYARQGQLAATTVRIGSVTTE